MIQIIEEVIDYSELTETVRSTRAGGVVLFLGTTREITGEQVTMSLDYEAYPEMAQKELSKLESAARQQWSLLEISIIHRLGHLDPGDISVAVAVSSVHRKDAFESAQWLMDRIKETVPIWKKENWADGTSECCLLYTSPSPRDATLSRMPSSA